MHACAPIHTNTEETHSQHLKGKTTKHLQGCNLVCENFAEQSALGPEGKSMCWSGGGGLPDLVTVCAALWSCIFCPEKHAVFAMEAPEEANWPKAGTKTAMDK